VAKKASSSALFVWRESLEASSLTKKASRVTLLRLVVAGTFRAARAVQSAGVGTFSVTRDAFRATADERSVGRDAFHDAADGTNVTRRAFRDEGQE
jgi:hypothetical protein